MYSCVQMSDFFCFMPSNRSQRNLLDVRIIISICWRKSTLFEQKQLHKKVKKIVIVNKPYFSVTLRQREILTLLSQRQVWTVGEIAILLSVSSAAATKNVNRLERKQLVKRKVDEVDRRYIQVSLTEDGFSVVNEQ